MNDPKDNKDNSSKDSDLAADYCMLDVPQERRFSSFERYTLVGGNELDKAVAWFAKQLTRFDYLANIGHLDVEALKAAGNYYARPALLQDPGSFFVRPLVPPLVAEREVHGLADGVVLDLSFPSSYQVQHPDMRQEYLSFTENAEVHARYWRHNQPARHTIVAVHGWTMGDQRINSLAFQPGFFYRRGMDVLLYELPFHGRRKPQNVSKQEWAQLFPSTHVIRTNEALAQAISDLRELAMYLHKSNNTAIGVLGMSLGAYISALWASLDPLHFCIPVVPLVSMADLAWKVVQESQHSKLYTSQGLKLQDFRKVYFMHCPLSYKPKVKKGARLIIAGLGDNILPAEQPKALWRHWNKPNIFWFEGGHLAEFKKSRAFYEIEQMFIRLKIAGPGE